MKRTKWKRRKDPPRRKSFKEAIHRDVIETRERLHQSPKWLYEAGVFNPNRRLPEGFRNMVDQFFEKLEISGYKEAEKRVNLEIILANLGYHYRKPVKLSLEWTGWVNQYHISTRSSVDIIRKMHEKGYIKMKIGYLGHKNVDDSRWTRIWATEELLEHLEELHNGIWWQAKVLVELKNKDKKLIPYKPTTETHRVTKILARINDLNSEADIRCAAIDDTWTLKPTFVAVYIGDFKHYGRIHTRGYRHYQGFNEQERSEITINGQETIEVDYSSMLPYMMYASEGIQYEGSPYLIVNSDPEMKPWLKKVFLFMMNTDFNNAQKGLNQFRYEKHAYWKSLGVENAKPWMDLMKEAHPEISHLFCNGKDVGMRMINREAKITLNVLYQCGRKGIHVLPIHDSFIVQKQYQKLLRMMMLDAYTKSFPGYTIEVH